MTGVNVRAVAGRAWFSINIETGPPRPSQRNRKWAACRSSGITTSLSCQVRFRSSGSCSIGPLRMDRRLGSTLTNQDAGWLSGGRGASLPAVSPQLLRGEHGSVGVLWWPPPPLSRLGWAWLHAASAGLGEAVSTPGLVSGRFKAVLEKEAYTSDSQRSLKVPRSLRAEWKGLAAELETLRSRCCPNVGT